MASRRLARARPARGAAKHGLPHPGAAAQRPGRACLVSGNGRSVPRLCETGGAAANAARVPNDAFTLAVQCGGCGGSVVRQRPRARFRRAAVASVALRPHGQRECASPAPLATPRATARRLHQIPADTGGLPGRRVATRIHTAAASPFSLRASIGFDVAAACLRQGVCPHDIAVTAIRHWIALFQAPTSASADHAASGSSVDERHSTTPSRERHERSSYQDPCRHWPGGRFCRLSLPARRMPHPVAGWVVDRRQARSKPPPSPRRRSNALGRIAPAAALAREHHLRAEGSVRISA